MVELDAVTARASDGQSKKAPLNCDKPLAFNAEKVFDDCMADQQFSLFGFRFFLGGTVAGAVFQAVAPSSLSIAQRRAPFYVLGAIGIIADHYAMKSYCDNCVEVLRNSELLPPADVLDHVSAADGRE